MTLLYFLSFRECRIVMVAALGDFTEWCDESKLDLNVSKTKEMIADCRRRGHTLGGIQIHGEAAEIVHSYK